LYIRIRDQGEEAAAKEIASIRRNGTIIDPDWDLVASAAKFKAAGGLAFADALCIATAQRLGAKVWTGDPEIIDRTNELPCGVVDLR
jgi:predicted nucleic acid-binding protein